jgi:hypothetical protein
MGFLEDMNRVEAVNDKGRPRPQVRQPHDPALVVGFVVFMCLIGLALLTGPKVISSGDAVIIASWIIGIVVMFAVLKLFTIATTLKEILAEMRKTSDAK